MKTYNATLPCRMWQPWGTFWGMKNPYLWNNSLLVDFLRNLSPSLLLCGICAITSCIFSVINWNRSTVMMLPDSLPPKNEKMQQPNSYFKGRNLLGQKLSQSQKSRNLAKLSFTDKTFANYLKCTIFLWQKLSKPVKTGKNLTNRGKKRKKSWFFAKKNFCVF